MSDETENSLIADAAALEASKFVRTKNILKKEFDPTREHLIEQARKAVREAIENDDCVAIVANTEDSGVVIDRVSTFDFPDGTSVVRVTIPQNQNNLLGIIEDINENLPERFQTMKYEPSLQMSQLHEVLEQIKHLSRLNKVIDSRMVLIFEEYDNIEPGFRNDFLKGLRAIYEKRKTNPDLKNVNWILSAPQAPNEYCDQHGSPYSVGRTIDIEKTKILVSDSIIGKSYPNFEV